MHRARWMAKISYSVKIWMFHSQFKLTTNEEHSLCNMCIFTIKVYLKAWMEASFPISALSNDLEPAKALQDYHDKKTETTALNKFSGQLWYFSKELVTLTFFDQEMSNDMKQKMVAAFDKDGNQDPPKCALRKDF